MRRIIKNAFRQFGFDIVRSNQSAFAFASQIKSLDINLVFDVGANIGQYASQLRASGYAGRIVSVEPVNSAFSKLSSAAASDPNWTIMCAALGSTPGETSMNVGFRTEMSSLRTIREDHASRHDWAKMSGVQSVTVSRLDDIFFNYAGQLDRVLLKMDVQGYEDEVLDGACGVLDRITAIQSEMALTPSYSNQENMVSMIQMFERIGFRLIGLSNGAHNRDGHLIEVDGLFVRPK